MMAGKTKNGMQSRSTCYGGWLARFVTRHVGLRRVTNSEVLDAVL